MLDHKPLSDSEVDDRLRAALDALGNARGETLRGHRIISGMRRVLASNILGMLKHMTVEMWPANEPPPRKKPRARPERQT